MLQNETTQSQVARNQIRLVIISVHHYHHHHHETTQSEVARNQICLVIISVPDYPRHHHNQCAICSVQCAMHPSLFFCVVICNSNVHTLCIELYRLACNVYCNAMHNVVCNIHYAMYCIE